MPLRKFILAVCLALVSTVPTAAESQLEELRNEQFRLLAEIRHELRIAEINLGHTSHDSPSFSQRRDSLNRLRDKFGAMEQEIELQERGQVVYVSVGSQNTKVGRYYETLRAQIEQAGTKSFPKVGGQAARGIATVLFELDLSGNILRVEVVQSSVPELREHAKSLLEGLSPLSPLPSGISSTAKRVVFVASFHYSEKSP